MALILPLGLVLEAIPVVEKMSQQGNRYREGLRARRL
jgi:hypothetical protein